MWVLQNFSLIAFNPRAGPTQGGAEPCLPLYPEQILQREKLNLVYLKPGAGPTPRGAEPCLHSTLEQVLAGRS